MGQKTAQTTEEQAAQGEAWTYTLARWETGRTAVAEATLLTSRRDAWSSILGCCCRAEPRPGTPFRGAGQIWPRDASVAPTHTLRRSPSRPGVLCSPVGRLCTQACVHSAHDAAGMQSLHMGTALPGKQLRQAPLHRPRSQVLRAGTSHCSRCMPSVADETLGRRDTRKTVAVWPWPLVS